MTYIPNSGGSGGSVGGSSDVALNNAASNDVLTYDGAIDKWINSPITYLLGSMNNPVTDPAALRPTGLPVVVWRTSVTPDNAAVGDWVFLSDGTTSSTSATYSETFDTEGLSGWGAKDNASNVARNTARDAGAPGTVVASLSWTAPASGNSNVQSPLIGNIGGAATYSIKARVSNGGAASRDMRIHTDEYDSAGSYLLSQTGSVVSIAINVSFTEITYNLTTQSTTTQIRVYVQAVSAAVNDVFYVDNVIVGG